MVASCAAYKCGNRHDKRKHIHFHRFPLQNEAVLKKWIDALDRKNFKPSKSSKLCSDHFLETDYLVRPGAYLRHLKPDAVPSVFNGKRAGSTACQLISNTSSETTKISDLKIQINNNARSLFRLQQDLHPVLNNTCAESKAYQLLISNTSSENSNIQINNDAHSVFRIQDSNPVFKINKNVHPVNLIEVRPVSTIFSDKAVQTEESTLHLPATIKFLRHKIKILNQKLRRMNKRNITKAIKKKSVETRTNESGDF